MAWATGDTQGRMLQKEWPYSMPPTMDPSTCWFMTLIRVYLVLRSCCCHHAVLTPIMLPEFYHAPLTPPNKQASSLTAVRLINATCQSCAPCACVCRWLMCRRWAVCGSMRRLISWHWAWVTGVSPSCLLRRLCMPHRLHLLNRLHLCLRWLLQCKDQVLLL